MPTARPRETGYDAPRLWTEVPDPSAGTGPDGEPEQVLRVDLTFLTSSWTCVYGRGCHGIDAAMPDQGCCTLGAHLTDAADVDRVAAAVDRLTPAQWQRHHLGASREGWTAPAPPDDDDGDAGAGLATRVVDGACALHNDPGFAGGAGCALHHLAAAEGVAHLRTKPDVCWQLPLRRGYRTVTRGDGTTYLEVSVGEYERRAWGPGGHDLDWWCTGSPEAHVGAEPVYLSLADELRELLGGQAYDLVAQRCAEVLAARAALGASGPAAPLAGARPDGRALLALDVHPATAAARAGGCGRGDAG